MKNKTLYICIMLIILMIIPNISFCIDTEAYKSIYHKTEGSDIALEKGGKILGVVQVVGTGIAVIMLSVIGTKYMISSVEEKAQLKEQLIPYIIGAILLFAGSNILKIVTSFIRSI